MKKKYLFSIIGVFLVLILTIGMVFALTANQGETVTISVSERCDDGSIVHADLDTSDGEVMYLYGVWGLKNPSGTVIQQGSPEQLADGEYQYSAQTTFVADDIGTYRMQMEIFYVNQIYNGTTWETIDSGGCSRFPMNKELIYVNYPNPDLNEIVTAINNLFTNWLNTF